LRALLNDAGFEDVAFRTACDVHKDERTYPVFVVHARRPRC